MFEPSSIVDPSMMESGQKTASGGPRPGRRT
jgi:hypothetical protein